jgi:uncharacterized protein YaeQ
VRDFPRLHNFKGERRKEKFSERERDKIPEEKRMKDVCLKAAATTLFSHETHKVTHVRREREREKTFNSSELHLQVIQGEKSAKSALATE